MYDRKLQLLFIITTVFFAASSSNSTTPIREDSLKIISIHKYCRYRNEIYPAIFFKEVTGFWCYSFRDDKQRVPLNNTKAFRVQFPENGSIYIIPYTPYFVNGQPMRLFYNYKDPVFVKMIAKNFTEEKYFDKWLECARNADDCCLNTMTNDNIDTSDVCPNTWDAWDCFDHAKPDTVTENSCPKHIYASERPCVQTSRKECFPNATWNEQTDYTTCQFLSRVRSRHIYHISVLSLSIVVCVPAIIIFFSYRTLRVTRVILHRNLLIAIVIKNIIMITSKTLITIDALDAKEGESVMEYNGIPCRVLAFFERAAVNAMYACMLVDGFYLHKMIVTVFRKDPPMYLLYTTVAVFSLVPIFIWSGFKATQANIYCWIVDESWRQWIVDGSRYMMLIINLILLLDIIRVLLWKLKRNTGSQHTKATLRATFILLPLFGIQFIMMSQRPVEASCFWDDVFYYISYTIDSLQGILVSILYCYFNKEVRTLLTKTSENIKRATEASVQNRRPTENRRITTATYISDPQSFRESKLKTFQQN